VPITLGRLRAARPGRARPAAVLTAVGLALTACSSGPGTAAPSRPSGHPVSRTPGTARTPGTSGPAPALAARIASGRLPAPVARAVVLPDGAGLTILGGLDSADQSSTGVFRLDPGSGAVTRLGSLPQATHDAAGAVLHGADVVFGGGTAASTASVQAWRPGSGGRLIGRLPTPRSDLAAATVGGATYLAGGYDGSRWSPDVLATSDGVRFRVAARLPVPVRYPAVAAIGGRIIVAGGQGRTGIVRTIQRIDPATGHATVLGRLPAALAHAAALVLDGHLYVVGGQTGTTASDRIWSINAVTGKVTPAGTLPMGVSDAGAATVGSTGYLVGGSSAAGAALDSVIRLRAGSAAARLSGNAEGTTR
jgi:hypothetical protein